MVEKKYFLRIEKGLHNMVRQFAKTTRRSIPGAYCFIVQEFFKGFPKTK